MQAKWIKLDLGIHMMSPRKMIATLYIKAYLLYPLQNNFSQKYVQHVAQFLSSQVDWLLLLQPHEYCDQTNIAYIYLLHKYESLVIFEKPPRGVATNWHYLCGGISYAFVILYFGSTRCLYVLHLMKPKNYSTTLLCVDKEYRKNHETPASYNIFLHSLSLES